MRIFLTLALIAALAGCRTTVPQPVDTDSVPGDVGELAGLDEKMVPGNLDRRLLAQAIFQETNCVRASLRLPEFRRLPKLDEAADLEAGIGRVYRPPSHTNPFPDIGTPQERVKYVGLKSRHVAENIALFPIYDIDLRTGVGVVNRDGRRHFVNPETQKELQPATYRQLAALVVRGWMESPGHRANLVNPALTHLGCSVETTASLVGVDQVFCVQVFFTPQR